MGDTFRLVILLQLLVSSNGVILRLGAKIYADFSIVLDGLVDSGSLLKSFDLKTKRQCVLECVSLVSCKSVNFHKDSGKCELVNRSLGRSKTHLTSKAGWVYMTTNEDELNIGSTCKMLSPCENNAVCEEIEEEPHYKCICDSRHSGKYCQNEKAYPSCKAVYNAGFRVDGVYKLENMGYHFCVLTKINGCYEGGWTLLLRTDGVSPRFQYNAIYWTHNHLFNHIYSLKQGLDGEEAKFDAYNKLAFLRVCIGLKRHDRSNTKFQQFYRPEPSMQYLMSSGIYKSVSIGRSKWLSLIQGSNLQPNCNKEGFNNVSPGSERVRIGILSNNENDCDTPDSVLGIGTAGAFNTNTNPRTGNFNADTTTTYRTKGFVLVQ